MKSFFVFSAIFLSAIFGGCAVSEHSVGEVGDQFQNGLQGRGQIVPNNPTHDSFGSDYH